MTLAKLLSLSGLSDCPAYPLALDYFCTLKIRRQESKTVLYVPNSLYLVQEAVWHGVGCYNPGRVRHTCFIVDPEPAMTLGKLFNLPKQA